MKKAIRNNEDKDENSRSSKENNEVTWVAYIIFFLVIILIFVAIKCSIWIVIPSSILSSYHLVFRCIFLFFVILVVVLPSLASTSPENLQEKQKNFISAQAMLVWLKCGRRDQASSAWPELLGGSGPPVPPLSSRCLLSSRDQ